MNSKRQQKHGFLLPFVLVGLMEIPYTRKEKRLIRDGSSAFFGGADLTRTRDPIDVLCHGDQST